jgi:hypothetical protein
MDKKENGRIIVKDEEEEVKEVMKVVVRNSGC